MDLLMFTILSVFWFRYKHVGNIVWLKNEDDHMVALEEKRGFWDDFPLFQLNCVSAHTQLGSGHKLDPAGPP